MRRGPCFPSSSSSCHNAVICRRGAGAPASHRGELGSRGCFSSGSPERVHPVPGLQRGGSPRDVAIAKPCLLRLHEPAPRPFQSSSWRHSTIGYGCRGGAPASRRRGRGIGESFRGRSFSRHAHHIPGLKRRGSPRDVAIVEPRWLRWHQTPSQPPGSCQSAVGRRRRRRRAGALASRNGGLGSGGGGHLSSRSLAPVHPALGRKRRGAPSKLAAVAPRLLRLCRPRGTGRAPRRRAGALCM